VLQPLGLRTAPVGRVARRSREYVDFEPPARHFKSAMPRLTQPHSVGGGFQMKRKEKDDESFDLNAGMIER
jgi:hypothetical protein